MIDLKIGDLSDDGLIEVLDQDRLCYSVRSKSNGAEGVRTLSRALVQEWVEECEKSPSASAQDIRGKLSGRSEIDKFEYGYAGTLHKLAKMILGRSPVIRQSPIDIRKEEFRKWMVSVGKSEKTAHDVSVAYLPSIDDELAPPTKNLWHGLRESLYGVPAPKKLYEVESYAELNLLYGGLNLIFNQTASQDSFDQERFNTCYKWAHSPDNHNSISSSWHLYEKFMRWRDENRAAEVDVYVDALSNAIKLFVIERGLMEWCAANTDNDATKPRPGCVANAKLRAAMPMTNNLGTDAQVVQWFKDYVYPDGKSWLDGIDTNGCVAFGGYINYLVTGGAAVARPAKFTRSLESAVKAIVKPASECFYNKDIHAALKYLGLVGFDFKEDFDEYDYQDALHAQRVIKRRLKDMGEKQIVEWDAAANQAKPNGKDPDFLTVNEFLWFVKEHFKEISNEAKNMSLEAPKLDQKNPGDKKWKDVISDNPDDMMSRLIAALLTKPFAILAGASGTGKSRLVRKLAYMTCLNAQLQPNSEAKKSIENFKMVQVKPNWHDSTSLLGYRSAVSGAADYVSTDFVRFILKAHAFPTTPFFVCLDEMNLAPVEHYFAEFLSAMESGREENGEWITDPIVEPGEFSGTLAQLDPQGYSLSTERQALIEKHGLYIPKNLFVVGTVNMDDTTRGFSRKVLDRAMTIVMDQINFNDLKHSSDLVLKDVKEGDEIKVKGLLLEESVIKEFVERKDFDPNAFDEAFQGKLNALREKLDNTPLAFAYRLARECTQYREAMRLLYGGAVPTNADFDELALDHCIFMKLLPRLAGNVEERQAVINGLNAFIPTLGSARVLSAKAFKRMMDASEFNGGYLSFWP